MKILALEFSSGQRSVAIVETPVGQAASPARSLSVVTETGPRGLKPLVLVDAALRQAQLAPAQINCVAVGLGPGSYTGIRVAIAWAQGWQLARNVRIAGVSSVEALAVQAQAAGLIGPIAILIDAQRNEFYLALYEVLAGERRIIEPLHLATFTEVKTRLEHCEHVIGPEATRWFPNARLMSPSALAVAQLAAAKNEFVSAEHLEPIYLRQTTFVKAPPPRTVT